jgi:hypothetical protein
MAYIPYIAFATLTLWLGFRFKVDAKLMQETRAILDARRAAEGKIV